MSRNFKKRVYETLGIMLKNLRKEQGVSVADIALHTDLSMQTINELENGYEKSYNQYKSLFKFYHKTFDIVLKDIN